MFRCVKSTVDRQIGSVWVCFVWILPKTLRTVASSPKSSKPRNGEAKDVETNHRGRKTLPGPSKSRKSHVKLGNDSLLVINVGFYYATPKSTKTTRNPKKTTWIIVDPHESGPSFSGTIDRCQVCRRVRNPWLDSRAVSAGTRVHRALDEILEGIHICISCALRAGHV